jgi:hypothetical protein
LKTLCKLGPTTKKKEEQKIEGKKNTTTKE